MLENSNKIFNDIEYKYYFNNYDGELKNNLPHGAGTCLYIDDREFMSKWKFPPALKYSGSFKNGLCHGDGVLSYLGPTENEDQSSRYEYELVIYNGKWQEGNWCGEGIEFIQDTYVASIVHPSYQGEWKNNKKHGKGILYKYKKASMGFLTDDGKIVGEWKNDKLDGNAVEYYGHIPFKEKYKTLKYGKKKWSGIYENGEKVSGKDYGEDELDVEEKKHLDGIEQVFVTNYEIENKFMVEPKELSLKDIRDYIEEFESLNIKVMWLIKNYEEVYSGYLKINTIDEEAADKINTYENKKRKIDDYCKELYMSPPNWDSKNYLSHKNDFKEMLLWKMKGSLNLPGSIDYELVGSESYSYNELFTVKDAKEYLKSNIISRCNEQLKMLRTQLNIRENS